MNLDFIARVLTLVETLLTEGVTIGPAVGTLVTDAKTMLSGGADPTDAQWAALDQEEQTLSDQIDAASKP